MLHNDLNGDHLSIVFSDSGHLLARFFAIWIFKAE